MRGIFVLVLVGCGRLAFDPLAEATDDAATDTIAGTGCIAEIASNGDQACARRDDGQLYCWGANSAGQLGDGTFTTRLTPAPAMIDQVTRIFGGEATMCAMRGSALWCWGEGSDGQVGDGAGVDREVPVQIVPVDVTTVAIGQWHTCAGRAVGGSTACWGDNSNGNLGIPAGGGQLTPLTVNIGPHIGLSIGDLFTCAQRTNGTSVDCWGRNGLGDLGNGGTMDTEVPMQVIGIPAVVLKVVSSCHRHSCVLTLDNQVYCWGDNEFGQVGTGGTGGFRTTATQVSGIPPAIDIALTAGTSCALTTDGVWCWGRNEFGEAANGGFALSPVPTRAIGIPTDLVDIEGGCATMFGIRQDRTLVAWGDSLGLGTGELAPRATAAPIVVPCD